MKKEQTLGLTVKKQKNISEWYSQVIIKSGLIDYSLVSGCIVYKPYSYAIWEKIKEVVDKRLKAMGVKNAYFPLFIPERLLKKEQVHVKGFSPEVAWVTHAGDTKLEERLAIRPTSETIMYESYAKWIRSWRDLPLKLNQWNNVVRWEFKHPVPFLRGREFLWNEGHTAFATKQEAEKEAIDILNMYNDICSEYLALPGIKGRKTEKEKFAGAEYTMSIEYFLPTGKAVQGPDSHHDGQNFAKAFDIKFLDKGEKEQYVWQNTWAITTRMIGIIVLMHGDDKGLVLPPRIAPNKIVIVPIIFEKTKNKVLKKARELANKLSKYDVILDDREEYNPGWKFNEWELKGIPIRIEIGPKDLEKKQVVLVRRDNFKKQFVEFKDIDNKIDKTLKEIQDNLFKKAKKFLDSNIIKVETWDEFIKAIDNKKLVKAFFCGKIECEDLIKDKSQGVTTRVIPFNQPKQIRKCVHCGKKAKFMVYFAKAY
jgi:prolyl-tRNA synthetase